MSKLPLEGVRIIDSTYVIAMPYACGIMTDLGAEVIKIEGIQHPDRTPAMDAQPDNNGGDDPFNRGSSFNQRNRGKRSLTLDLSQDEGREAFKELVKISDIVVENYTPRVMRRWELEYSDLKKIKPDIIMLSNTAYGHGNGPYSNYPGQATTMEGIHGLTAITGYLDDIPSKAGASYVDFVSTWNGLLAVATALRYRNKTGKGQWIDLGMYQAGCFFNSEYMLDYIANDRENRRIGNRHPSRAPQGCYPCKEEDTWCTLSVGDDQEWHALCQEIGKPELVDDPRFATLLERQQHHDALDETIAKWSVTMDKFEMMERLQSAGVPAGALFTSKDANLSPHYWNRGFLEKLTWPPERDMGTRVLMGRPWQLSKTPLSIREGVHPFGQDNRSILQGLLDYSDAHIAELEQSQVIGDRPIVARYRDSGPPPPPMPAGTPPPQRGNFEVSYDPDYKKLLGI